MSKITRKQFDICCAFILTIMYFVIVEFVHRPIACVGETWSMLIITTLASLSVLAIVRLEHYSSKWIHSITMIFAPFACYSIFLIGKEIRIAITIIVVTASIVVIAAFEGLRIKKHIRVGSKKILSACMSVIMCMTCISIPVVAIAYNNIAVPKVEEDNTVERSITTLEDHIEEISRINSWNSLTADEKLNMMNLIAKIESDNLGLEETPLVRIQNMKDSLLGSYSEEENLIRINVDHLEDQDKSQYIKTIAHECFHAWEYKIIDVYGSLQNDNIKGLYPYNKASIYKNELDNYVSGGDDYKKYSSQAVEQDAEAYGNSRCQLYMEKITGSNDTNNT